MANTNVFSSVTQAAHGQASPAFSKKTPAFFTESPQPSTSTTQEIETDDISALSSYLGIGSFGSLDCVQRFMKGAFETNPTLPSERKIVTWDPQRVLDFLEPRFPHDTLTVKELTLKLTLFLAILSGQRSQTIHALDIDNMAVSNKR
ncbi:hypothetical protein RRG08_018725 [Elysia crispata]|uniref:Tyr recombinase domain-containing protein n=1 Tax=Elysia crispata TaxID=231223 RepID=A0AAE1A4V5_9GAST|nr:hypothetical protein RRG08_018725 [Elysia crispata]